MKKITFLGLMVIVLCGMVGVSNALVLQLDQGSYQTPDDGLVIAAIGNISLSHDDYIKWNIQDLPDRPNAINIIFHGIYDDRVGEDFLALYIQNSSQQLVPSWQANFDASRTTSPNWSAMGFTQIGVWSDLVGGGSQRYDVVFTITDPALLSFVSNGDYFNIGIDPDCHYYADSITVEAVPEPAIMMLFGSGLLGLSLLGRRGSRKYH
jgi:hypothetical protein